MLPPAGLSPKLQATRSEANRHGARESTPKPGFPQRTRAPAPTPVRCPNAPQGTACRGPHPPPPDGSASRTAPARWPERDLIPAARPHPMAPPPMQLRLLWEPPPTAQLLWRRDQRPASRAVHPDPDSQGGTVVLGRGSRCRSSPAPAPAPKHCSEEPSATSAAGQPGAPGTDRRRTGRRRPSRATTEWGFAVVSIPVSASNKSLLRFSQSNNSTAASRNPSAWPQRTGSPHQRASQPREAAA